MKPKAISKLNKAKSKSSLRPRSYTKFKDYIEIMNVFQKAHEKLSQTAINDTNKYPYMTLTLNSFRY